MGSGYRERRETKIKGEEKKREREKREVEEIARKETNQQSYVIKVSKAATFKEKAIN